MRSIVCSPWSYLYSRSCSLFFCSSEFLRAFFFLPQNPRCQAKKRWKWIKILDNLIIKAEAIPSPPPPLLRLGPTFCYCLFLLRAITSINSSLEGVAFTGIFFFPSQSFDLFFQGFLPLLRENWNACIIHCSGWSYNRGLLITWKMLCMKAQVEL